MKIRTSYVTNSSGSNTSRVIIENKRLLEILNTYKNRMEMLTKIDLMPEVNDRFIEEERGGSIHNSGYEYDSFWCIKDNIEDIDSYYLNRIKYNIYSNNIEELYPEIIEIFDELENELKLNKEFIIDSYDNIEYDYEYDGDIGLIGTSKNITIISKSNICPKCGNILHIIDDFIDDFESEVTSHKRYLLCSNKKCQYEKVIIDTKKEK